MLRHRVSLILAAVLVATLLLGAGSGPGVRATAAAPSGPSAQDLWFTTSDGVELRTTVMNDGALAPRPTVVEFTPYGDQGKSFEVGPDYNYLLVQLRGTGSSHGRFDALGPRSQRDVVEVLRWACDQPWSTGTLAVAGFSASAIMLYNSWHQKLPCVEAAVLRSGTHELYRDLLWPGGMSNLVPGIGVLGLIGAPALMQGPDRLADDPVSAIDALLGLAGSGLGAGLTHPTLDSWWRHRGWRGDANGIPALLINGFFDVESRGAFQGFRSLRRDGAHLLMVGGHDGFPAGTDGGARDVVRWLDHHLRDRANGVDDEPPVRLFLSRGDRRDYLDGDYATASGANWPLPGTRWRDLYLRGDGALVAQRPTQQRRSSYPTVPSVPFMTDVPNTAIIAGAGIDALAEYVPALTQTGLSEALGLAFATPELPRDVTAVGPASLEVRLATTTPGSHIWVVLSDVAPDGTSHPVTVGRLNTDYPGVVAARSLRRQGRIVQPYGDYATPSPATPLAFRDYRVELWPVGNVFEAGHRVRVQLVGASAATRPALPGLNTVVLGGKHGARLLFPVAPAD